jgi:hypothetical protein
VKPDGVASARAGCFHSLQKILNFQKTVKLCSTSAGLSREGQ